MRYPTISIQLDILLEDRGDHWAALIEQIGTRVYAADKQSVCSKTTEMVEFIVSSFSENATLDDFLKYLDNHGVQYSMGGISTEDTRSVRPQRYRLEDAVSSFLDGAVSSFDEDATLNDFRRYHLEAALASAS